MKRVNLLKSGLAVVAFAMVGLGFANFGSSESNHNLSLKDLQMISNANAEGAIECGGKGSGCKFTLNGNPMESTTHKEK